MSNTPEPSPLWLRNLGKHLDKFQQLQNTGLKDPPTPKMGQQQSSEGNPVGSTPGAYQSSFSGTARGAGTSFNPAHPSTSTSAGLSPYSNLSNASRTFAQPPAIYTRASYTPGMSTTSAQDVPAQGRPKTMEEELAAIRSRTQAAHNQPAVPRALEPLPVSGHGSPSPATSMHGLQQSAIRPSLQSISQPISQPRLSLLGSNARAATSQSDERQQAAAQPASAHTESAQLSTELQQLPTDTAASRFWL